MKEKKEEDLPEYNIVLNGFDVACIIATLGIVGKDDVYINSLREKIYSQYFKERFNMENGIVNGENKDIGLEYFNQVMGLNVSVNQRVFLKKENVQGRVVGSAAQLLKVVRDGDDKRESYIHPNDLEFLA